MNLLAFDTSTDQLSIALQHGEQVWQFQGPGGAQSSSTLLPAIRQGLDALGLQYADLDAIVFGRGPGSFTGLRTACAIAQGLALGAHCQVLPVDTLLAVAEEARQQHGCTAVLAVLDARMDEVYHAAYHWQGDAARWQETQELGLCAPQHLPAPAGLTVAGNAQAAYGERLAPGHAHVVVLPTATALLRLAPGLIADGGLIPAAQALPRYIRDKVAKTTAEREAERAAAAVAAAATTPPAA